MGIIRLRIRELAAEKGWTIKEVSDRFGVNTVQLRKIVETVLNKSKKSNPGVRLPTPPNPSFITN